VSQKKKGLDQFTDEEIKTIGFSRKELEGNRMTLMTDKQTTPTLPNKKVKSDRETQFWEAEECKDIVAQCTKEEVFDYIQKHPKYKFEDLDKALGIGCFKWEAELKREGKI